MNVIYTLDDLISALQECKDNCMSGKEKVIFVHNEEEINTKDDYIYVEKDNNEVYIVLDSFI